MTRPNYLTALDCAHLAACAARRAATCRTDVAGEVATVYAYLAIGTDAVGRIVRGGNPL